MAAISGLDGAVAHACGIVTKVNGWSADLDALEQDITSFDDANTDGHQRLMIPVAEEDDLLKGCSGTYRCPLSVPAAAIVTAGANLYDVNIEQWMFWSRCTPHETTPLGAAWRTYKPGIISSGCSVRSWIDDTEPLVVPGEVLTVDLVLNANAADKITFPSVDSAALCVGVSGAVEIDGSARLLDLAYMAASPPTPAGIFVLAGGACQLTLTAHTGRTYTASDAIVTSVLIRVNRREGVGEIECGFVVNGSVVPA